MQESTFFVPQDYAGRLTQKLRSGIDRQSRLFQSYLKMFGVTEEDLEKDPALAGRIQGMVQSEIEESGLRQQRAATRSSGFTPNTLEWKKRQARERSF